MKELWHKLYLAPNWLSRGSSKVSIGCILQLTVGQEVSITRCSGTPAAPRAGEYKGLKMWGPVNVYPWHEEFWLTDSWGVRWKDNGPHLVNGKNDEKVHIAHILTPSHGNTPKAYEGMEWRGFMMEGSICWHTKMLATSHWTWPNITEEATGVSITMYIMFSMHLHFGILNELCTVMIFLTPFCMSTGFQLPLFQKGIRSWPVMHIISSIPLQTMSSSDLWIKPGTCFKLQPPVHKKIPSIHD